MVGAYGEQGLGQTQEVSSKRWQGPRRLCKGLTISLSTMEGVGGFETASDMLSLIFYKDHSGSCIGNGW